MRPSIALLTLAALLVGCGHSVDVAKQREALMNLSRDWATHTTDVDKFVSYYAPDASVYVPGMALKTGTDQIHEGYAFMFAAPGTSLTFTPTKAEVSAAGDLGYTTGTYEMKTGAGSEKGKYVAIWAKQANGEWKVKEDIFNSDASDFPASAHVVSNAASLKWGAGPDALPKGATVAVVAGDPSKPGPFVMRAHAPAGYRVMPHWHPTDENITVLEGTVALGMGDSWDAAKMDSLGAGGVAVLPANMRHSFLAKTAATIQVHGMGPFAITYVNPADDPRTKH